MQELLTHISIQETGVIHILTDMTDKNEISIQNPEEKYRNLIEQAADGIFVFDYEYNFISANKNGCLMLGYDKIDLLKLNIRDFIPAQFSGKLPINLLKLSNGHPHLVERQLMRKDGTILYTEVNAQITSEGNIQAIVRDTTDRKHAQEKLQKAKDRYDILSQATSDTIWDWDIPNNQVVYNEGITQMFGYGISEVDNVSGWWKMNIHPDDLLTVSRSLAGIFNTKGHKIQLEYRFRCADGSFKYIYDRAFVIYSDDNNPIRMIGAMQDITYAKEEEKRMVKAIIDAQKKERCHIGQELHDNINQILLGSLLTLSMTKEKQGDIEKIFECIEISRGHIGHAINEVRKLSHDLTLISFEECSLQNIFEGLLTVINVNNKFNIELYFDEIDNKYVCDDIQVNLYRIFQEQIKNIIHYSEATSIEISITRTVNAIGMRIFDNGNGFNIKTVKKGSGLSNIRKRAESLSGKFILNSSIGKGCEIIIDIPLQNRVSKILFDF